MKKQKRGLGPLESQFFAFVQMKEVSRINIGDLRKALGLSAKQERELLSRLSRAGLIVRLKKGVYLVPKKIPPGGKWRPNEFTLVNELMEEEKARYFISGPAAFYYYGLQTQIPNIITVYNDKISGRRTIAGQEVEFIKTKADRIGGWKEIKLADDKTAKIASLPRSIADAIYDWKRFDSLPEGYLWIKSLLNKPKLFNEFIMQVKNYTNSNTRRRVGAVLDDLNVKNKATNKILKTLKTSQGWVALNPNKPIRGKCIKKWGIIKNE